jgi:hypothetical protein
MADKKIHKNKSIPEQLHKYIAAQQITHDFILELYEKSKKLKGKEKAELLATAKTLSKHVGRWLVE